jgi:uncharacterized sporulation protein YeaH/YhbH (DUF444 family)
MAISLPTIDIPHFAFGDGDNGVGRGPGKKGDVIKKDPEPGSGHEAGDEEGEGIIVSFDQDLALQFLQDELKLPALKPKPSQTYEDIKIKYNDIALTGPESLRHNRRTMLQALKRLSATGEINKLHTIPGFAVPVKLITPINSDRRYRQYKEIKIPSSNAVVLFGRDGSISMDQEKCDIVSDMAYWMDAWIRKFYDKVERAYFWHDVAAQEVDEEKFYTYRYGGGTLCSSCFKLMSQQLESRFTPERWNIYCFYFTDGENIHDDNNAVIEILKNSFPPSVCNLFGITQVLSYSYSGSVREAIDKEAYSMKNVKTVSIGTESHREYGFGGEPTLTEEERNEAIKNAIKELLGSANVVTDTM